MRCLPTAPSPWAPSSRASPASSPHSSIISRSFRIHSSNLLYNVIHFLRKISQVWPEKKKQSFPKSLENLDLSKKIKKSNSGTGTLPVQTWQLKSIMHRSERVLLFFSSRRTLASVYTTFSSLFPWNLHYLFFNKHKINIC